MKIGIDIGTSYSCASTIDGEGQARPIELSTAASMYGDKYSLPSAIFVEDNGNILVGQAAMNNRIIKPENFIMEFKRLIGQSTPVYLGDKEFLPEDLYTELFRHIKGRAEKILGEAVDKAYITYPASFLETKKAKIRAAAQRAGLFNVDLVDEPTSAAMCYCATEELEEGQTVLIYDFGGGTFDAALVKYEGGSFTLPTGALGLERCGGIDIDRAILGDLRAAIDQKLLEELPEKHIMRLNSQLAEKAVKAKHQLTESSSFSESILVGFDEFPYELSRDRLEGMVARLVGSTIDLCRKLLQNAGMKVGELAGIIMVGGTSRIPLVRRMVERFADGVNVIYSLDPELAVCQGAALYDECNSKENDPKQIFNNAMERYIADDYDEAVKLFRKAAEQGDSDAQNYLGFCYNYGFGVEKDCAEAVKWYRKAAEQGNADAQYSLGGCYYFGEGVEMDYSEAVKWYRKGAEQGDADAQCSLGGCYYFGAGVEKDYAEAVKWYRKAAEQSHAFAQYSLGECYYFGNGVEKDYAEAVKWYRKAAEQGDADSQYSLGYCYYYGNGVENVYSEAVKWYRKAAEQGHADAQNRLGCCYYNGNGATKDYAEAVKWFKTAAEQGDADAQNKLGICYESGYGVTKNLAEAARWYKKAAEQGLAEAQYRLGEWYRNGLSPSTAEVWYKKAAEQGYEPAVERLKARHL